jgi:RHS repeat-associated protein
MIYTSREFDFETGLHNRMRYYLPNLGRFSQKDIIVAVNLYSYSNSNPIGFRDLFGLYGGFIPGLFIEIPPYGNYAFMDCTRNYLSCVNGCFEEMDSCWQLARDCIKNCPKDNYNSWRECVGNCITQSAMLCNKTGGFPSCVYSCIDELQNCLWGATGETFCGWEAEYGCSEE